MPKPDPNALVRLFEECPVSVAKIHAEMTAGGARVSLSTVQSWSTGRTWPNDDNRAELVAALERLGATTADVARRVRTVQRPAVLSGGKRGKGKRGRPPKSSTGSRPRRPVPPDAPTPNTGDAG